MSDSASGGYITPIGAIAHDQELEDIFQTLIVGITSLPGQLVRPRWQVEPPPMPAVGVDWCAFAVKSIRPDDGPYFDQHEEHVDSIRHEDIEVSLSFYGNQGQLFANSLRNGLAIPQNIAQIRAHQIKFVGCSEIVTAPDFLNQQYVHRYDITASFRRKTQQNYAIKTFLDYQINIKK